MQASSCNGRGVSGAWLRARENGTANSSKTSTMTLREGGSPFRCPGIVGGINGRSTWRAPVGGRVDGREKWIKRRDEQHRSLVFLPMRP